MSFLICFPHATRTHMYIHVHASTNIQNTVTLEEGNGQLWVLGSKGKQTMMSGREARSVFRKREDMAFQSQSQGHRKERKPQSYVEATQIPNGFAV